MIRHVEVDELQNGELGITEILFATGIADSLSDATTRILSGLIYVEGYQLSNPTIYPDLRKISTILSLSPDRKQVLDIVELIVT